MLVDDHPLWRDSMRKVLGRRDAGSVVAEASDGEEAIRFALDSQPDVIVMDVHLPDLDGIQATARLREELPDTAIVVLSASDEQEDVIAAVQAGASGYLVKTADADEIADAVTRVHAGELVFPPELAGVVLEEFRRRGGRDTGNATGPSPDVSTASRVGTAAGEPLARFELEGEYWSLSYGGKTVRLPDLKGLRDIAGLLANPGREIHVLEVVLAREGANATDQAPSAGEIANAGLRPSSGGGGAPLLDATAKAAYRRRIEELQDELEEAEAWRDDERAARAREELDFITSELKAAVGLGGRDREAASEAQRARVNVSRAVSRAIERIEPLHKPLARHLRRSVRTGMFCSYDSEHPIEWVVRERQ